MLCASLTFGLLKIFPVFELYIDGEEGLPHYILCQQAALRGYVERNLLARFPAGECAAAGLLFERNTKAMAT